MNQTASNHIRGRSGCKKIIKVVVYSEIGLPILNNHSRLCNMQWVQEQINCTREQEFRNDRNSFYFFPLRSFYSEREISIDLMEQ